MEKVDIAVVIEFGDATIEATASVPDEKMRPADLLPILFGFTNAIAAVSVEGARQAGRNLSCGAGCCFCCHQVVPVAECEAVYLAELVAAMRPEQQARVRKRFADALAALGETLVAELRHTAALKSLESRRALNQRYFALQVACPFLEDQRCSIYDHRPTSCREYMVSSPRENCRTPGPDTLRMITPPVRPSQILYCFGDGIGNETTRWVPLVLALEWAEARMADPQPSYDAPQMFRNFVAQVERWMRMREMRETN